MKTKFTIGYIMNHRGCYTKWKIILLFLLNSKITYTLKDIINTKIPNKDKFWFLFHYCNFNSKMKRELYNQSIETRKIFEEYDSFTGDGFIFNFHYFYYSDSNELSPKQQVILNEILKYSKKYN
jgi:hypothetical protein